MFYIGFITATRVDDQGAPYADGELSADAHRAPFRSDLRLWSKREYEKQWREGVARLVAGKHAAALVTSYRGPTGGLTLGSPSTGTVTILTDDWTPPRTVTIAGASVPEGNSVSTTVTLTLTLSAPAVGGETVAWATSDSRTSRASSATISSPGLNDVEKCAALAGAASASWARSRRGRTSRTGCADGRGRAA